MVNILAAALWRLGLIRLGFRGKFAMRIADLFVLGPFFSPALMPLGFPF